MEEVWKDIKDYEGLYQVSNSGHVKSLSRWIRANTCGKRFIQEKCLSECVGKEGYKLVVLCKNGKHRTVNIHRLVANAFIANPQGYKEVNHKDENRLNNTVDNLEWCDRKYNSTYGTSVERSSSNRKKQVVKIEPSTMLELECYNSAKDAEIATGISRKLISSVCNGRNKTTGGFIWRFKEKSI